MRAVERVVGPFRHALDRPADVTVRFVDELPLDGVRLVGVDDAAFDERAFYVLAGPRRSRVVVRIPVENLGGPCEVVCRRGVAGVPYLREILNLTVLANGAMPVHAAAFELRGVGTLVTGWSRGGKTEILLAAMAAGARYVGDDWVYVDAAGNRLHGMWSRSRSGTGPRRLPGQRVRSPAATRGDARRSRRGRRGASYRPGGRPSGRALLDRRGSVRVPPDALFGSGACLLDTSFDRLLLGVSHAAPEIAVTQGDPEEVARRMAPCLAYEHRELIALRQRFRFAFPDAAGPGLDGLEAKLRDGLLRVFRGKETHVVAHPYPTVVPAMRECLGDIL